MAPYCKYCIYGELLKLSLKQVVNLTVHVGCRTMKHMSQKWLDLPDINNYKLLITCKCITDMFR
jgi:hypothetical protein